MKLKYIIIETVKTIISLFRVLINKRLYCSFPVLQKDKCEIYILGNGPSLNESLTSSGVNFTLKECICVNDFAGSDFFEVIKPCYYLLLDPAYWSADALPKLITERNRIYMLINSKTNWCLNLLLPLSAKYALNWNNIFRSNSNIKISFFNYIPLCGFKSIIYKLYKNNLGMPPAANVLVVATFIAINIGYKKIYLLGADHSWQQEIVVNDENIVCLRDKHFYDKEEVKLNPWYKGTDVGGTWKMHEILKALAIMFEGYQYLEDYSKYRNVKIYNASTKTYIDAFERCNLKKSKDV